MTAKFQFPGFQLCFCSQTQCDIKQATHPRPKIATVPNFLVEGKCKLFPLPMHMAAYRYSATITTTTTKNVRIIVLPSQSCGGLYKVYI